MTNIFLIRHATPDWSRTDLPYHLPPGPPLTAEGEAEAAELGVFLKTAGVRMVYTSPLERCRRTAEIAVNGAGMRWVEAGPLLEWQPGEDAAAVRARLWPWWEQVVERAEPAALITHGGPIAVLLSALGLPDDLLAQFRRRFDRNNPLPPAGAWLAERAAGAPDWTLSLSHLPAKHRGAFKA